MKKVSNHEAADDAVRTRTDTQGEPTFETWLNAYRRQLDQLCREARSNGSTPEPRPFGGLKSAAD